MTTMTAPRRGIELVPVIGWIARDLRREPDSIWYLIVALLSLLVIATATWGLPVLTMTALALVPVMFVLIVLITLG
ncbi:MAG: hypothetical protein ACK4KW_01505 [Gemmobacter sp.]